MLPSISKEQTLSHDFHERMKNLQNADASQKDKLIDVIRNRPYPKALDYIQNELEQLKQLTSFGYSLKGFREDCAYAIHRAIETVTGTIKTESKKSPSGETPPTKLNVRLPDGTNIKVIWGKIPLNMGEDSFIEMGYDKVTRIAYINGQCINRYVPIMDQIIEYAKFLLQTDSIYAKHAIQLDDNLDPTFMEVEKYENMPIYLSEAAEYKMQEIWARIRQPEKCISAEVSLKLSSLFAGPYGEMLN